MRPLPEISRVRVDGPLLLIARSTLDLERQALVEQASAALGARPLFWCPGQEVATDGWPSLLIAGLPRGARRLPPLVCDLVQGALPGLPILLLCDEPLRRPTMTTHAGRVFLLDPSCSVERLTHRIRMMLTGVGRRQTDSAHVAEQLHDGYWLGVCRQGGKGSRPSVENHSALGLTILFSREGARVAPSLLDSVTSILSQTESRLEQERSFLALLNGDYGVVHLDAQRRRWKLYFPWKESLLELHSPIRLPPHWNFGEIAARPPFLELSATEGDVVVASTTVPPKPIGDPRHGAPGLFDALVAAGGAEASVGVVVELL